MMDHLGFIVAAYAVSGLVVGALVVRAVLDWRAQQRALAALEARGLTRRAAR